MQRLLTIAFVFCGLVYIRTTIPQDISPWALAWVLWMVATTFIAVSFGWQLRRYVEDRGRHRR